MFPTLTTPPFFRPPRPLSRCPFELSAVTSPSAGLRSSEPALFGVPRFGDRDLEWDGNPAFLPLPLPLPCSPLPLLDSSVVNPLNVVLAAVAAAVVVV